MYTLRRKTANSFMAKEVCANILLYAPLADFRKRLFAIAFLVAALAAGVAAQISEFLPEVDAYYKVTPAVQIWMQAKETYEAGNPVTAEFGPSLNFSLKPMVRLQDITKAEANFVTGCRGRTGRHD